jgi:hypothetical protein
MLIIPLSNQLTDFGKGRECVGGENVSVDIRLYRDTLHHKVHLCSPQSPV